MGVITIQSSVAVGHVGNSAAVFALQRLGVEAWPVHTVQLSNHTGHAGWGGGALGPEHVGAVLDGLARHGAFASADAVLTGYLGDAGLVPAVAAAVDRIKAAGACYCCDPVIGNDAKGLFVSEAAARALAGELLPRADICTPNRFELACLTGAEVAGADGALAAADALARRGPRMVAVTSLPAAEANEIGVLLRADEGAWRVTTPRLDVAANGAGDAFAAMFLARLVRGEAPPDALAAATASIFGILAESGAGELTLVAAQDEIARPSRRFNPVRLR
jgi:pyridoxine kinase